MTNKIGLKGAVVILAAALVFAGCSGKEASGGSGGGSLTGKYYMYNEGSKQTEDAWYIEFRSGGTLTYSQYGINMEGTYKVNGNIAKLDIKELEEGEIPWTIDGDKIFTGEGAEKLILVKK